eukprot:COSAG04_NODE_4573_length_2008_cov_8.534835_2_plen_183_part_00
MASARAIERTFPGPRGDIWIDPPPANPASDYNIRAPQEGEDADSKKTNSRRQTQEDTHHLRSGCRAPCHPARHAPSRRRGRRRRLLVRRRRVRWRRRCSWACGAAAGPRPTQSPGTHPAPAQSTPPTTTRQLPDQQPFTKVVHQNRSPKSPRRKCITKGKRFTAATTKDSRQRARGRTHGRS